MKGKIPQAFIDDLLDRVDITEVIGNRVNLKRTGRNFKALCPFHQEKTPSFSVNPDKQFYYCFGCGAGGNSIGFVMDYERLDFPAAIEALAHGAGLQVPREDEAPGGHNPSRQQNEPIYALLTQCSAWYQHQLRHHQQASSAVNYLKGRGLTGTIAKQFAIGYAPPGWDNLLGQFGNDGPSQTLLERAGMIIEREKGGFYDRFRERIMFPIRDTRGRVVAFGGRVLGDDVPKYLNSPETPVFNKSRELYGLYEAIQANRRLEQLLIVEGYMDVVALAQHGISFAAATLGTAVGKTHLERIFRHTAKVTFCFDGDSAGRSAAVRALEASLPAMRDGRQASFLFLAEGEDPDSLVRRIGAEAFLQLEKQSQPIADFLFEHVAVGIDTTSIDGRARLSKLALPLINQTPDGVFKHLLLRALSQRTGLDLATLETLGQGETRGRAAPVGTGEPTASNHSNPPDTGYDANSYDALLLNTPPADRNHDGTHQPSDATGTPTPQSAERPATTPPRAARTGRQPAPAQRRHTASRGGSASMEKTPLRSALAILLFYPQLATLAPESAEFANLPGLEGELLREMLELLHHDPETRTHTLVGSWLNTEKHALAIALLGTEDLLDSEEKAREEFRDALQRIQAGRIRQQREDELRRLEADGIRSPEQKARYLELLGALRAESL